MCPSICADSNQLYMIGGLQKTQSGSSIPDKVTILRPSSEPSVRCAPTPNPDFKQGFATTGILNDTYLVVWGGNSAPSYPNTDHEVKKMRIFCLKTSRKVHEEDIENYTQITFEAGVSVSSPGRVIMVRPIVNYWRCSVLIVVGKDGRFSVNHHVVTLPFSNS